MNTTLKIKNFKKGEKKSTIYKKVPSFFDIFKDFNKKTVNKEDAKNEDAPIKEVSELQREYDDSIFLKDDFVAYAFEYYLGIKENGSDEDEDFQEKTKDSYKIINEIEIDKPMNNKV